MLGLSFGLACQPTGQTTVVPKAKPCSTQGEAPDSVMACMDACRERRSAMNTMCYETCTVRLETRTAYVAACLDHEKHKDDGILDVESSAP